MVENNNSERSLIGDIFKDMKHQRKASNIIMLIQSLIIIGLIVSLVFVSLKGQKLLKEAVEDTNNKYIDLLTNTEFTTEYVIETDNNALNNGNITVNKN